MRLFNEFLMAHLEGNGFEVISIERSHLVHISTLASHHRDPFDRMLVAQSRLEMLTLVSADPVFDAYGVSRLW